MRTTYIIVTEYGIHQALIRQDDQEGELFMRSRRLLTALLVMGTLLSAVTLSACKSATVESSTYEGAIKAARNGVWQNINSGEASSGQAAILDGGQIVYSESFGMADRATSEPVTGNTLFNSGSIGKAYCTAAVMKLVDDGKVELDSPTAQYLPRFKMEDPRYKDITVRMLLNHQSGLPGTTSANGFGYKPNPDFYEQVYENLARSHLKADPGFAAPYCNDGFTLAEMIVAEVSGKEYIDYLTDSILKPLNLTRTGPSIGARPDAGVAAYYQSDTGKKVPPEAVTLLGAGGLSTTAEELVMFGDSFCKNGPRALSQKSIDEMMKAHPSTWSKASRAQKGINPEPAYGLGLDAVSLPEFEKQGIKVIIKGGDTMDFHSELMVVPDRRIAVAVIKAGHGSSAYDIAESMLREVLVEKGLMKKEPARVSGPLDPQPLPADYGSYSGDYDSGSGFLKVTVDPNANTVTTLSEGSARSLIYNDGSLRSEDGGELKLISVDGQTVLIAKMFGFWMTLAQRLPQAENPRSLAPDINGFQWLRRNVKPYESISLVDGHLFKTTTDPTLPGYVLAEGANLVGSPTYAGMTSGTIRDLSELNLVDHGGQTWLQLSDMIYSPATVAVALEAGKKHVNIAR